MNALFSKMVRKIALKHFETAVYSCVKPTEDSLSADSFFECLKARK